MISLIAIVAVSYLLGSFPTGIILGKLLKGIDVRHYGSKTMGATNVYRVLGAKLAIVVLAIDVLKGVMAVLFVSRLSIDPVSMPQHWIMIIAGFASIIGHIFPIWIGFKGGKGVGTAAGVYLAILPVEVGIAVAVFIVVVTITRYVSLGSILAATVILVILLIEKFAMGINVHDSYLSIGILLVLVIVITHRQNIGRLLRGQENKFGQKTMDLKNE